jgi:hypothetical protein
MSFNYELRQNLKPVLLNLQKVLKTSITMDDSFITASASTKLLQQINIRIQDIVTHRYYINQNIKSCNQVIISLLFHEYGHITINKTYNKLIRNIRIVSKLFYKLLHKKINNEDLSFLKKILIALIVFFTICFLKSQLVRVFSNLSEIYCDLYSASCGNKEGLLLFFGESKISWLKSRIYKLTDFHPSDTSRYNYVKNWNLDIRCMNKLQTILHIIKIYLLY